VEEIYSFLGKPAGSSDLLLPRAGFRFVCLPVTMKILFSRKRYYVKNKHQSDFSRSLRKRGKILPDERGRRKSHRHFTINFDSLFSRQYQPGTSPREAPLRVQERYVHFMNELFSRQPYSLQQICF
jgi:hypothetical protein